MAEPPTVSVQTPDTLETRPATTQPVTLITEQQVVFGTAAALPVRETLPRRVLAVLHRMVSTAPHLPAPPQHPLSRNAYYFERARMGREMDRL